MTGMLDHVSATEKALAGALVELAELRATLAELAADADAKLGDECRDRQLIAEHLIDRLTVLSGEGEPGRALLVCPQCGALHLTQASLAPCGCGWYEVPQVWIMPEGTGK